MSAKKRRSSESAEARADDSHSGRFPIAGIGASAGGLEALEQFISEVPADSGLAYVVVQHLDPTQKGMLPELLQRVSKIDVYQARNSMMVRQNCLYVIPPNKSMSILNGVLYLFEPQEARGLRLPVDFFLRSLAEDRKELSIGIILSGMGSDGSLGLCAIKENNGIVMVQEPATAKFDSMPRNAIDSVVVDIVASAGDLPGKLFTLLNQVTIFQPGINIEVKDKSALDKIIILLRDYTGNDFSLYKKSTMYRRIERRMGVHKIDKISSYVNFLQGNPNEGDILFKELMIGVTNFFRDPTVWEKLGETLIPDTIVKLPAGSVFRVWVPGCSTGEEAYTISILFKEVLESIVPHRNISLLIFATDIDNNAVEKARKGIFPANIANDISPHRLNRFFVKTDEGYSVNTEIRELIVFAQHNLIMHPPFINIDFISCRNLLIYLESELQKKIIGMFHYSINKDGTLLLGSSETIGTLGHLFSPVDSKLKIYRRSSNTLAPDLFNFPSSFSRQKPVIIEKHEDSANIKNIETIAGQLLLKNFTPPGVLVNEGGDIVYISGRTGKYLEPATGKANMNIFAMLREGLRQEFPVAFHQAILKRGSVVLHNIKVGAESDNQTLDVNIHWIDKPEQLKGMIMIIFIDVPGLSDVKQSKTIKKSDSSSRESELEKELQYKHEEMQATLEEMQTSQEELKSTNEELQSANEELQSTNEELTSSKEEMQSLNEELQTVNAELQSKVDEFARVDNDMKNLLNSTDIATLFLDKELNIRRYTNQATKLFKLIKSDIGRTFTDQVSDLDYPEMTDDAIEVIRTLNFIQKQVPGKNRQWFTVRIMPYRTFDDRIDGLVITFINITDLKQTEEKIVEQEQIKKLLLNSSSEAILQLSDDFSILEFNPGAEKYFGTKRSDALNQDFVKIFIPEPMQKTTVKVLKKMLKDLRGGNFEVQAKAAGEKMKAAEWSVNILSERERISMVMILKTKNS